jgi:predicted N-acetyltransferase YhbS
VLTDTTHPLRQSLSDGLVMRTAACEADVEAVAAFNALIHGPGVAPMTLDLYLRHPDTTARDLVFVEDAAGQVVSSLCLIPWKWHIDGVSLQAGEMGIVGTADAYRRRGLVRAQDGYFKRRLQERGCLVSHIQGIPYYYRQFGYEYALPLEGGLKLELEQVGEPFGGPYTFRPAGRADIPALCALHERAAAELAIHAVRSESVWGYLLAHSAGSEMECATWLIEQGGAAVGYMRVPRYHFGEELAVNEVSALSFSAATAVLAQLRVLAQAEGRPGIRLNLPANCTLMRLARSLGARDLGTYAWQIYLPDPVGLLRALTPALERRLAASPFAGLTRVVVLSFYRSGAALHFEGGRLAAVSELAADALAGFSADLRLPPTAFTPLVLGYRNLDELRTAYPDVGADARWRLLLDTLFPRGESFLYTVY